MFTKNVSFSFFNFINFSVDIIKRKMWVYKKLKEKVIDKLKKDWNRYIFLNILSKNEDKMSKEEFTELNDRYLSIPQYFNLLFYC